MASDIFDAKLAKFLGDRTAKVLASQLELQTVGDLLRHYPRRYLVRGELTDIASLVEGEEATILAEIEKVQVKRIPGRKGGILEVIVTDGAAKLSLTFFNQAWREKELVVGRQGLFAGKLGEYKNKRQLTHPDYILIPDGSDVESAITGFAGKYLPIYGATAKLPSWKISQCMRIVLEVVTDISDFMPDSVRTSLNFPTLQEALLNIHQPDTLAAAELARKRLTFDEALLLQLVLVMRRAEIGALFAISRKAKKGGLREAFDQRLPFTLTQGQKSVANEIDEDLARPHPMYRLLQGEVGSGKTIIALRAALSVIDSGGQVAILAPTEILAQQHFQLFKSLLGNLGNAGELNSSDIATSIAIITGSLTATARSENIARVKSGDAGIVVGTHALLSESVEFHDLGLIVIDEQHRFGVEQRNALRMKAAQPPHILVMTATPIPRTVAMTVFGDLDISTLRELPLGRQPITTHVIAAKEKPAFLDRAWVRITEEIANGFQAYVVAPRISDSDNSEDALAIYDLGISSDELALAKRLAGESEKKRSHMTSVAELYPTLQKGALKKLRIAALHGRLASDEKTAIMAEFSKGNIDVLITTTVIEVGVDIPNATTMVIMDADRFGVSQLHQLRGRIGRGTAPGLCLLVTQSLTGSPALARLNAVADTLDGFELSRIDLEQRSEGDVLGESQSGAKSHLKLLRVLRDEPIIEQARTWAEQIISQDPDLTKSPELKEKIDELRALKSSAFVDKM